MSKRFLTGLAVSAMLTATPLFAATQGDAAIGLLGAADVDVNANAAVGKKKDKAPAETKAEEKREQAQEKKEEAAQAEGKAEAAGKEGAEKAKEGGAKVKAGVKASAHGTGKAVKKTVGGVTGAVGGLTGSTSVEADAKAKGEAGEEKSDKN